jgi:hypothetical protein
MWQSNHGGEAMSAKGTRALLDRWMSDADFRAEMRRDPLGAVSKAGIALSDSERAALKTIDWNGSDQELQARVSKCNI